MSRVQTRKEQGVGLFLNDMTPLQDSDDYSFGYAAGQRTAHATAYLKGGSLERTGLRLWLGVSRVVVIDRGEYLRGFCDGDSDELQGLAHPLPRTDQPYRPDELIF